MYITEHIALLYNIGFQVKIDEDWNQLEQVEPGIFDGLVDFSKSYPPNTKVKVNVKSGGNKYNTLLEYTIWSSAPGTLCMPSQVTRSGGHHVIIGYWGWGQGSWGLCATVLYLVASITVVAWACLGTGDSLYQRGHANWWHIILAVTTNTTDHHEDPWSAQSASRYKRVPRPSLSRNTYYSSSLISLSSIFYLSLPI